MYLLIFVLYVPLPSSHNAVALHQPIRNMFEFKYLENFPLEIKMFDAHIVSAQKAAICNLNLGGQGCVQQARIYIGVHPARARPLFWGRKKKKKMKKMMEV